MGQELLTEKSKRIIFGFWFGLGVLLVAVDQVFKFVAAEHWPVHKNYWFAFSLPLPVPLIFTIYGLIFLAIILYIKRHYQNFSRPDWLGWALIIAGGVSNVGERLMLGYVRDFIPIFTGVFNLADGYIIAGIFILLLFSSQKKIRRS